jgi:hypothetical protein
MLAFHVYATLDKRIGEPVIRQMVFNIQPRQLGIWCYDEGSSMIEALYPKQDALNG